MVRIRSAGTEDWLVVQELLGQLGYLFTAAEVQARLSLLAMSIYDPVLLATQDDKVVGMIALHFATMLQQIEPVAQVTALVVDDGIRGAGIGKALIAAGCDLANQSGCGRMELRTANGRTEAHAFYRKLGFVNSAVGFSRTAKETAAS